MKSDVNKRGGQGLELASSVWLSSDLRGWEKSV